MTKEKTIDWKPKDGERYYYIDEDLTPYFCTYNSYTDENDSCCSFGNCFKTEYEAEKVAKYLRENFKKIIKKDLGIESAELDFEDCSKINDFYCIEEDFIVVYKNKHYSKDYDIYLAMIGNCFDTQEDAKKVAKYLKENFNDIKREVFDSNED